MKKIIRIVLGVPFIAFGAVIVFVSFSLFPHPMDWGKLFFSFAPLFVVGIGIAFLGVGIIAGMTWREAFEYMTHL